MVRMHEIDDAWKRQRELKERQIANGVTELQAAVAKAETDLRTLAAELEKTRNVAGSAIRILAEMVLNHGQVGSRSEIIFSKQLSELIDEQGIDVDRNVVQALKVTAQKRIPGR